MADEYSLYEAKARLSALVRQVREGRTVIITVHGEPAAELRPVSSSGERQSADERIADLDARGLIMGSKRTAGTALLFPIGPPKTGALQRFLKERE
jgi:prevent-host-death family protein